MLTQMENSVYGRPCMQTCARPTYSTHKRGKVYEMLYNFFSEIIMIARPALFFYQKLPIFHVNVELLPTITFNLRVV